MSGASAVIHKQNKFINKFNSAGAIAPESAVSLEELGIRRSYIFDRMASEGVFVECENGNFFINNQAVQGFKERRRNRAFFALAVLLVFAALYYFLGGR
jgi:hypothetical protein